MALKLSFNMELEQEVCNLTVNKTEVYTQWTVYEYAVGLCKRSD